MNEQCMYKPRMEDRSSENMFLRDSEEPAEPKAMTKRVIRTQEFYAHFDSTHAQSKVGLPNDLPKKPNRKVDEQVFARATLNIPGTLISGSSGKYPPASMTPTVTFGSSLNLCVRRKTISRHQRPL